MGRHHVRHAWPIPVKSQRSEEFHIWSCSPGSQSICLNTDLAKKPPECLEYIVVHELAHLLEPTHNTRFITLMDQFMPKWRFYKDQLNRLPVRHEDWVT
ncbi:MAG: YgjP-like metallopeptidase domain-containing protein [Acidithiobacillus sp.]